MNLDFLSQESKTPSPIQRIDWMIPCMGFTLAILVWVTEANVPILRGVQDVLSPLGEPFWAGMTLLGDALVGPLFLIPFIKMRPRILWEGTLAALVATAFTHILKPVLHIARPPAALDLVVIGPRFLQGSFPSGHTTTAFTVLGLLIMVGMIRGWGPIVLAFFVATVVGISRVVAGVHWPSDVLMGMAGGWLSAMCAIILAQRWPQGATGWPLRFQFVLLLTIAVFDLLGHDTGYGAGMMLQRLIAFLALMWLAWDAIEAYYTMRSKPHQ